MNSEQGNQQHSSITDEDVSGAVAKIESVVDDNPEVIEKLLDRPKVISFIQKRGIFHGPLPHPDHLREYEDIVPGMAERILKLTEDEQKFRHTTQTIALKGAISKDRRAQWMAFILSFSIFALGGYLMFNGEYLPGAALITANVVGLAGVFIFGRKIKQRTTPDGDQQ